MTDLVYEIPVRTEQDAVVLKPTSTDFNTQTYQDFRETINNIANQAPKNIVIIDFESIISIDEAGVAIISYSWHLCCKKNLKMILCNLNKPILKALKNRGLYFLLEVCNSYPEALELANQYSYIEKNNIENTLKLEQVFGNLFETTLQQSFADKKEQTENKLDITSQIIDTATPLKKKIPLIEKESPLKQQTQIVVVNGEEKFSNIIRKTLTNENYDTTIFNNAMDAIKYLNLNPVNIVISEINLPKVSGLEFCSIIKKQFSNIYFIFLSDNADLESKIKAFEMGTDDYITKPFNKFEFLARVKAGERINKHLKQMYFQKVKLEKLVVTDPLTNLYNRKYFQEQIVTEMNRAKRYKNILALVMVDIDYFKRINDTYGHLAGDEVLKRVGNLLLNSVRTSDLVCRIGGEEFVIILPETDSEKAFTTAEKIRDIFNKTTFLYNNIKINLTVSIGITIKTPEMEIGPKDFLDMADKALYIAKNEGRNRTIINNLRKNYSHFIPPETIYDNN